MEKRPIASPDDRVFALVGEDGPDASIDRGTVFLDAATGRVLSTLPDNYLEFKFSPDGRYVAALRQVTPGQLLPELLSGSGTPIWTRPSYSGAGTVGQGPLRVDIAGSCVAFCGIRVTWSNGQAADTSALDVYALDGTRL